jgi:endonuclease/exonuclease/phosphatase (EEP) superfamily protein YafD
MARSSKALAVAVAVAVLGIAVVAVVLRSSLRCAGFAGPAVTAAELPAPCAPGRLRVATWNLRNFPLDERPQDPSLGYLRQTNICDLEAVIEGLDAAVIGVAEIRDARRFPPVLRRADAGRRYQLVQSRHGGRRGQRLAIAWDERLLEAIGDPVEIREVTLEQDLRPAFGVRLRSRLDPGLELTVIQVHLTSSPSGYRIRVAQHRALLDWIRRETEAGRIDRLILMGDFNTTGGVGGSTERELERVDRLYAAVGLRRLANANGCTEYWEGGGEPDGLQVPSLLDHIWVRGFGTELPESRSWLHCERRGCDPFVSAAGQEDGTFWDVSDHCPVTAELPWPPAETGD